jgi:hypothetical protein
LAEVDLPVQHYLGLDSTYLVGQAGDVPPLYLPRRKSSDPQALAESVQDFQRKGPLHSVDEQSLQPWLAKSVNADVDEEENRISIAGAESQPFEPTSPAFRRLALQKRSSSFTKDPEKHALAQFCVAVHDGIISAIDYVQETVPFAAMVEELEARQISIENMINPADDGIRFDPRALSLPKYEEPARQAAEDAIIDCIKVLDACRWLSEPLY